MFVLATEDICPVSTADTCPVSTENICPVLIEDKAAEGRQPAALLSSVETGQIQMSAAETGQMSAVEKREMYSSKTGQRPVAIVEICLVSTCTSKDRKAT